MKYCEAHRADVRSVLSHIPGLERLSGKRVLITGGTGLICSGVVDILHLCNAEKNAGITILLAGRSEENTAKRFYNMTPGTDYTFVPFDATAPEGALPAADYVIHGASNANPAAYVKSPVETMEANLIGLNRLLKSCAANGVGRLLYISSSEVYGQKEGSDPYGETDYGYLDILNERASYPSAKRAAETLCVAYGNEYGLDTVIVRPGHIYGPAVTPYDNRATAQFTRNAVKGEDIVMKSAGSQLRSYCYYLDCASAILAVLLNGEKANAYNISNPHSVITISAIAKEIARAAGRQLTFENPADAEAKGYNLMSNSSLKSEKLEALGWQAEFSPAEGAKRTVEYYG
jgi:nucleoside-diphosphate-sugar epimerase